MNDATLQRLASYVTPLDTRQGILGREALGAPAPGDADLAQEVARRLADQVGADGTVGHAALPTIWRVHELLDLGCQPSDPTVRRLLGWLMQRHGRPGAYGAGCDRARHAQQLCEHHLRGFFAVASPHERLAPITLPTGKLFRTEPTARFAASCLGLRAVLRAGLHDQTEAREHLDSLATMAERWTEWEGFFAPDAIVAGMHALALGGCAYRSTVDRLVGLLTRYQRPAGDWPAADLFGILDALLAIPSHEAREAVRRAATALAEQQHADGSFGGAARQERALVGLRALLAGTARL